MSIIEIIKEFKLNPGLKSKLAVLFFRLATYHANSNIILYPFTLFFLLMHKIFNELIFGVEISYKAKIGNGFVIWHAYSVVISSRCSIGKNFHIRQCCTCGANRSLGAGVVRIGDNVSMGANSCILGDDIAIGNNVKLGAGVILMKDVPNDSIIIGHKPIIKNANGDIIS